MFKIASWNVNSIKVRLADVLAWLAANDVDVLALQETKSIDACFPEDAFHQQGYYSVFSGQKTYNGVAIISRHPMTSIAKALPDYNDEQKRLIAATINNIRVVNVYVPNGSEVGSDKFAYKLAWLSKLNQFVQTQLMTHKQLAVLGDFNIAPADIDVYDSYKLASGILVSPAERDLFKALLQQGLKDSFRLFAQKDAQFSWWDYRAAAFRRNHGLRIDHILLTHTLSQACQAAGIDIKPRQAVRPSDHAPVWVTLDV
ncbi:MAG: exodeoxyribonuclease III [Legionellaceae bacterium]|nr:exodeoxyribonuclease III [Legionellaceae bacterium]HAF87319.1 exodeoxyribonuclease III [Legionellales bacterium]HCA89052.1 exodeoxyribonuclease III [Legionellales bacterium]|tara:strand:+ start:6929 stop:7699 length:771 start_codon:yes stop_codon:yes gene_type:complete